jgi:hypothetical protein
VSKDVADRSIFIDLYAKRSEDGTAIKWLKFHTTYAFAYATCQTELPVAPGPFDLNETAGTFCGGGVGRKIRKVLNLAHHGNWQARRVAYDILMSKIGDPVAPDSFVEKSMETHRLTLTKKPEQPENIDPRDRYTLSRVKDEIRLMCREIYGGRTFSHQDYVPSLHACFENSMARGGGLGKLLKAYHPIMSIHVDGLYGMVDNPKDGVAEVRFIDGAEDVEHFQGYVDSVWIGDLGNLLNTRPVGILEPLKVRIITKGQAAEYYRAIELQKYMHSNLKRHPVFQYIGHPIDDDSWVAAFGQRGDLKEGEFYVSGDYQSATDNLRSELGLFTWQIIAESTLIFWQGRICMLSETPYYLLGRKCIAFHRLFYGKGRNEISVEQSWGQLMGSPMSFPILCIINAAASLVAMDEHLHKCTRMRVNGDDIGFIANESTYATWKYTTQVCGLEFSLGKNYISRDFLIMNSELRRPTDGMIHTEKVVGQIFDPDTELWYEKVVDEEKPRPWKLEGFLNQSILYGTVKKGLQAGQKKDLIWTDLESLSHEALRGIPEKQQLRVHRTFIKAQKPVIETVPFGCNLYIPRSLGGAGVVIPAGRTIAEMQGQRSEADLETSRRFAAYLACNNRARLQRPSPRKALFGDIRTAFKEILSISDRQVPRMLRPKPLRREQHVMLGGTCFLGYLIRSLAGKEIDGGQVPDSAVGGTTTVYGMGVPIVSTSDTTKIVVGELNNAYRKWLSPSLHCSLTPMGWDSVSGYQEHLELVSYIEFLSEKPASRFIDSN